MTTGVLLPTTRTKRASGAWTAIGLVLLLVLAASQVNGFGQAWPEWLHFVSGASTRPGTISHLQPSIFGCLAAMTVLTLAFVFPAGLLVQAVCGKPRKTPEFFRLTKRMPLFATLMTTIIAEELFARALFLGAIGHFWRGQFATYALFFIGNSLWALVHLHNYPDKRDRKLLRVLPQFTAGTFLTAVYLHHGFFAALLVHVAYDMILFATDKRNAFNKREIWSIAINVVYLVLGLSFLGKPLSDLAQWGHFNGHFTIHGWGFWSYFWAFIVISSILTIVGDLLVFDYDAPEEVSSLPLRVLTSIIAVLLLAFGYWAVGLFTSNPFDRLLILAIALLFLFLSGSGSSAARAFWISIPSIMVTMCALFAVEGFLAKVGFMLIASLMGIPEELVRHRDT